MLLGLKKASYIIRSICIISLLTNLVFMFQELSKTMSHKTITKCNDCLQQIALGLTVNEYLASESLLEFSYGLATDSIPALVAKEKDNRDAKQLEYESRKDPDAFLIPSGI